MKKLLIICTFLLVLSCTKEAIVPDTITVIESYYQYNEENTKVFIHVDYPATITLDSLWVRNQSFKVESNEDTIVINWNRTYIVPKVELFYTYENRGMFKDIPMYRKM